MKRRLLLTILCLLAMPRPLLAQVTLLKTIPVDGSPERAIVTPNGQEVYVTDYTNNTVSVIRPSTNKVIATLSVGSHPDALVISPDGKKVYIGQHGGGVSVIDTTTHAVQSLNTGGGPVRDITISPDGSKVFLAQEFSGLGEIRTSDNSYHTISGTACPEGVVVSPDGKYLYVNYQCAPSPGIGGHDPIYVFDAKTDIFLRAVDFLPNGSRMPNVGGPIAISPNSSLIFANGSDACGANGYDHGGCNMTGSGIGVENVIRASDDTIIATLNYPNGIGRTSVFPDSKIAAMAANQELYFLDTSNFNSLAVLDIAASGSLAFTPDGEFAYAPIPGMNEVALLGLKSPANVPEPSFYAFCFAGLTSVFLGLKRKRKVE